MLRNGSAASRISFEGRDADSIEKAFASRMSFEPNKLSCLGSLISSVSTSSLADTAIAEYDSWREQHPCALEQFDRFASEAVGKLVAVFLDYDGTLTPIVSNPDAAFMSEEMRGVVRTLAELFPTAIISGRGREKVEGFVQLRELYYAGSHGMDIVGPQVPGREAEDVAFQAAAQYAPLMDAMFAKLEEGVRTIPGASVEHNKFCVSVHFRNCSPEDWPAVVAVVDAVADASPDLKVTRGRKVLEVRPQVNWDKGSALSHLMGELGLADPGTVLALYIGDDRTDEDAFKVLAERRLGAGILVSSKVKPTAAQYTLRDPAHVQRFLAKLVEWGRTGANLWHVHGGCKGWALNPSAQQAQQDTTWQGQGGSAASAWGAAAGGPRDAPARPGVAAAGTAHARCTQRQGASAASNLLRHSPQAASASAAGQQQGGGGLGVEGVTQAAVGGQGEGESLDMDPSGDQPAMEPPLPSSFEKLAAASSFFAAAVAPPPSPAAGDVQHLRHRHHQQQEDCAQQQEHPPPPATPAASSSDEGQQQRGASVQLLAPAAALVAAGSPR